MQQQLINLSPDIKRLLDDGYELEISGGHLLVHHIPYVNKNKDIDYGSLVCILNKVGPNRIGAPHDHTIYFRGQVPCHADGTSMDSIINNSNEQQLTPSILVNHYFSSKPKTGKYKDYYEKVRTYAEILTAQAREINPSVTYRPNKKIQ